MITPYRRERVRLARALEQQLPAPEYSPVWPPFYDWERYGRALRRVNLARRQDWSASFPSLLEELERAAASLSRQLQAPLERARQQCTPQPQSGLRDILADLEALEQEFPEVRWDLSEKTLSIITEPVELDDIALGPFEIRLEYQNLEVSQPYRVLALEPHPACGDDTTTHPHVRHDSLCEGDGRAAIQRALRQGRFYDLFVLITQILQTYNADSAYVSLDRWEGRLCPDCGATVDLDDTTSCQECRAEICGGCSSDCYRCDQRLCGSCQAQCGTCCDTFCRDCLRQCPGCSEDYCASCLAEGRCEDCQETESDEEPDTPETAPESAVQPLGLGQAAVSAGSGAD